MFSPLCILCQITLPPLRLHIRWRGVCCCPLEEVSCPFLAVMSLNCLWSRFSSFSCPFQKLAHRWRKQDTITFDSQTGLGTMLDAFQLGNSACATMPCNLADQEISNGMSHARVLNKAWTSLAKTTITITVAIIVTELFTMYRGTRP